jgi:hypothetical protein
MGVEAGVERQERGVDVEHPPPSAARSRGDRMRMKPRGRGYPARRERGRPGERPRRRPVAAEGAWSTAAVATPSSRAWASRQRRGRWRGQGPGARVVAGHGADKLDHVGAAAGDQDGDALPAADAGVKRAARVANPLPRADAAQRHDRLACLAQERGQRLGAVGRHHGDHADAAVEGLEHLASAMPPASRSQAKTGGRRQARGRSRRRGPRGRTRGRFSVRPPPVMWASAWTPPARIAARAGLT